MAKEWNIEPRATGALHGSDGPESLLLSYTPRVPPYLPIHQDSSRYSGEKM